MSVPDVLLDLALATIERRELRGLSWGYVDGSLSEADVDQLVAQALETEGQGGRYDPGDVREALIEHRLLFERNERDGYRYRTRFAEGVRLLSRLRQIFPNSSWASAPTLVADFRVDARPRSVPRRDIAIADALRALGLTAGTIEYELADAILRPGGSALALARFQVEAATRILERASTDRGAIVSAGTGSGKTLAFYLPALVSIAPLVSAGDFWVKAVAVYPRRELLKDQFGEAFAMARRIDSVMARHGKRSLRIGTFYGQTPFSASDVINNKSDWREIRGVGYVCPFLRCPVTTCGGELIWRLADLDSKRERLTCRSPGCPGGASEDQIVLTRRRAQDEPPDIVFTTLEMLNQRLADTWNRPVLGIQQDARRRARLILLDEIHTYEGTTGAQSALVLRRWRHAVGRSVRWVGLSATLRDAPRFFAELTGVEASRIVEVTPRSEELDRVSMAYQVILRGDPVSQTSLLSTSIQASFLLARLLDPVEDGRSAGRYGSRLFTFTDDLDVVNRLYDDLRDAEGYDLFGRPTERRPLAALRAAGTNDGPARDRVGQLWRAPNEIGWPLSRPLHVTRTTSQDQGVDPRSDVVVATASLEVGFDDPTVGAVLQHKSPRQFASFVQRKGRAGRRITMRPWTVTVLSDYGRDRLTYQAYDQLFDPTLPPLSLPVKNGYILRMQAVFSFLDWLAELALQEGDRSWRRGWWWHPVNGPTDWDRQPDGLKSWLRDVLRDLLRGAGGRYESLRDWLGRALGLESEPELVKQLLWEPPRSIMLEVVPTLARRLYTRWQAVPGTGLTTDVVATDRIHPLPDFVPSNLFSDLSLPEVEIIVPPATVRHVERTELMPLTQALKQMAPGRVTRRFAYERGQLFHWVPIPRGAPACDIPIDRLAEANEYLTQVLAPVDGQLQHIPCYRPWRVRLEKVSAGDLSPSSNGRMHWASQLVPTEGTVLRFPANIEVGWGRVARELQFFVHGHRSPITVRRFATGVTASLRTPRGEDETIRGRFVDGGGPAAIGFEQEVDGIVARLRLPNPEELAADAALSPRRGTWRTAYVRDRVMADAVLGEYANVFQRDWLFQVYMAALVSEAARLGGTLGDARARLRVGVDRFRQTMATALRANRDEGSDDEPPRPATSRLIARLDGLLDNPVVLDRLDALAADLEEPEPTAWGAWLLQRVYETFGEAFLLACQALAPRHAAVDTLLLDLGRDALAAPVNGLHEVWITESTPGGSGMIESILHAYAEDPRSLFTALEAALTPGDLEVTSVGLDRFVELATGDEDVRNTTAALRGARGYAERDAARDRLYRELARRGLGVGHALGAALNHRLFREGFDADGDRLVGDLLDHWRQLETRLGIAVDLRVFCAVAVEDGVIGPRLRAWVQRTSGGGLDDAEIVGVLAGVLWPRPAEIRGRSLETYSPYRDRGRSDPLLVRELVLDVLLERVELGSEGWEERLRASLAAHGRVALTTELPRETELHRALLQLIATPIDVRYLQFYPVVEQVVSDAQSITIVLILRELAVI